jgi:hypothetical protein
MMGFRWKQWGAMIAAAAMACQPGLLRAQEAEPAEATPPWQISDGAGSDRLYVSRDVAAAYAKDTRSRDGNPGPNYWQNHSRHTIRVALDPPARRITGEQEILYTNNSPDPLPVLIFRLYMNAHHPAAMREQMVASPFFTDGIIVEDFGIDGVAKEWSDPTSPFAAINVPGSTVHIIPLETPLAPGASVRITMRWHYDLVKDASWKEGVVNENSFFLAYFYPRLTSYSDYGAWDILPFTLGREFNNDINDYDVSVTLPRDYVVWATGELVNSGEVLQPAIADKLAASRRSDAIVTLATPQDIREGRVTGRAERLTWKWQAQGVSDFAIALSNTYRWQATSVEVDPATGRRAGVELAYAESATDFENLAASARQTLRWASTQWPGVPYPYPKTTIFLGSADEEYPMMVNDGSNIGSPEAAKLGGNGFTEFVAAHEILHSWFPFYMGINEKRYPFMDEGWTTAFEYLRNREVLGPAKADALFRDFRINMVNWPKADASAELPIITPHDALYGQSTVFAYNQYGKAALGYLALKDLMGDAAFKTALHTFMTRWHGKRPLPWDMFASFNNAGVGNHDWFFARWFFGYNYMDLAIGEVGDSGVTVRNPGGLPLPFDLAVTYADGSAERIHRTPAAWQANPRETTIALPAGKRLASVTIDTGIFEDFQPSDNDWKP